MKTEIAHTIPIPTQAIYTTRENESWEVGNITQHPFAPIVFVMAVRVRDGRTVCLQKSKLTMLKVEESVVI